MDDKFKKIIKDNINLKGFAYSLIDEVLEPALKQLVLDSKSPIDDAMVGLIYPVLELEIKKKVDEFLDKLIS